MAKAKKKSDPYCFPLRVIDKKVYTNLEKEAEAKYTSVNSLINSILEEHQKKIKKDLVISK